MTLEERIIAYVDGELAPAERARFERDMRQDASLGAEVERHRALAKRVNAAYAPIAEEPPPAHLVAAATVANDPVRRRAARLGPWAAVAASLVVGLIVGRGFLAPRGPIVERGGALVADGQLATALTSQLSAQPGVVKVGLTLKTPQGRYCRTFESRLDRLAGVACRQDGRWVIRTVTAWRPPVETAYRQAASDTPPEVLATVDALSGQSLDAEAERAARDAGWRAPSS
jgi:hypothetical protein